MRNTERCSICEGPTYIDASGATRCAEMHGKRGGEDLRPEPPTTRGAVSAEGELLAELVEPQTEECRYDHHGYCQAHWLHERPCPVERAKALLSEPERGAVSAEERER